jgi:hypothetical protein
MVSIIENEPNRVEYVVYYHAYYLNIPRIHVQGMKPIKCEKYVVSHAHTHRR